MSDTSFDFDLNSSDLNIGIEVEYPGMNPSDKRYVDRGRDTNDLQSRIDHVPLEGRAVYDGTVGLEIVSEVLELEDSPGWYASVIDYITEEWNTPYQPTGLMATGNTAGMHLHLSELSRSKAEDLYELSQTPWAKVLFCSSIANNGDETVWPVFRGGRYCNMNFGTGHYDCVNERRGGHYEWRLPEPVDPDHFEIIAKFLRLFEQSTDMAVEYAQEVLDDADDRITAIRRAEAVGMDIDSVPVVERDAYPGDPENFFERIRNDWGYPEVYHVEYGDNNYYVFESRLEGDFEVAGVTFTPNDIVRADELTVVHDPEEHDEVRAAFERRNANVGRETEATEELKKIVKKKKS